MEKTFEILKNKFNDKISYFEYENFKMIQINESIVKEVFKFLKTNDELNFDFLNCISSMDFSKLNEQVPERFALIYTLTSTKTNKQINLICFIKDTIDSIADIYPGALWHERESYDLMGIKFNNKNSNKRILLEENWKGHPLQKDYEFPDNFEGIDLK